MRKRARVHERLLMNPALKVTDFLFPPLCLHCQTRVEEKGNLFCSACSLFFEPINPQERCYYCFSESPQRLCQGCRKSRTSPIPLAAVWEYIGPVATFMQRLKNEEWPLFISLASSFLTYQWSRLDFPEPDYLLPLPPFWLSLLWNGKRVNKMIAQNLSKSLSLPVKHFLYMHPSKVFEYKVRKKAEIEGKKILLLDIDFFNEVRLKHLSQILLGEGAEKVCALTLCWRESL